MSKMKQLPIGFPEKVRKWIKNQAEKKFLPEAGFVRQLVIEKMEEQMKEKREQNEQEG